MSPQGGTLIQERRELNRGSSSLDQKFYFYMLESLLDFTSQHGHVCIPFRQNTENASLIAEILLECFA